MAEIEIDFFYEKLLTIEFYANQIEKLYAKYSAVIEESVGTVYHGQKLFSLMVWSDVSKSWNCPLIFVEKGFKIRYGL